MGEPLSSFLKIADLKLGRPEFPVSERVLEPVVRLRRSDSVIIADLAGRRYIKGVETLYFAEGLTYDWVSAENMAYPLPVDIYEHLELLFQGLNPLELTFAQALEMMKKPDGIIAVKADDSVFVSANERAASLALDAIPGLMAELYPYQRTGVAWLLDTLRFCGGAVLADEMGLGKTLQIISVLLSLRPSLAAPALIVCPTTLLANWSRELAKFAPSLASTIHWGPNRAAIYSDLVSASVIIAPYDTVVSDISLFRSVHWSIVICDEAQAIKNPSSLRRGGLVQIPRNFTIPVTGTPVENSLLDLWSLVDFTVPGLLGTEVEFSSSFPDSEDGATRLTALTNPLILRRRIEDVARDLPERVTVDLPISLGSSLAAAYNLLRAEVLAEYGRAGALVATGKLALFCAHPWLTIQSTADEDWEDQVGVDETTETPLETPKIELTLQILREAFLGKRKVLLFANFNKCGEIIRMASKSLPEAYWNSINGSTPQADRQTIVDEFTEFNGPALLILNPKAAGTGLNITAATVVIHYTQVWNPAIEAQASARAHRRGQTLPVTIYRLFYEDTVEAVMLDRTLWKSELANSAVPISTRDTKDLKAALNISPGGPH